MASEIFVSIIHRCPHDGGRRREKAQGSWFTEKEFLKKEHTAYTWCRKASGEDRGCLEGQNRG